MDLVIMSMSLLAVISQQMFFLRASGPNSLTPSPPRMPEIELLNTDVR
jgi:hypothetical protein